MKNFSKIILVLCILAFLSSCAKRLSPKRTDSEQQQVKEQVMKLLEEEYHQPFKLVHFNYEYKTQYPNASGNRPYVIFGEFSFKVKAVENPIIIDKFVIFDDKKESINKLIDSFKKNQLINIYCDGFTSYYSDVVNKNKPFIDKYTQDTEKYCKEKNQTGYKIYKDYYLKHHTN